MDILLLLETIMPSYVLLFALGCNRSMMEPTYFTDPPSANVWNVCGFHLISTSVPTDYKQRLGMLIVPLHYVEPFERAVNTTIFVTTHAITAAASETETKQRLPIRDLRKC